MLRTQKEQNTNDRPDSSRHRRGAQNSMVSSAPILGVLTGRDRSRAFARGAELILIPIAGFVISALCEAYGLGWRLAVHWRSELAEANGSPRVPRVSPHRRLKRRSRHMYKLVNNNR